MAETGPIVDSSVISGTTETEPLFFPIAEKAEIKRKGSESSNCVTARKAGCFTLN